MEDLREDLEAAANQDPEITEAARKAQKKWSEEMDKADKRLRKFTQQGNRVNQRYLSEAAGYASGLEGTGFGNAPETDLNLFYTNVSTKEAMLYGSTPTVDVSREHADPADDVARVGAMLYQRMLQADVEPSGDGAPDALRAALQDRLIPGLGVCRVRYEVETAEVIDFMTQQPVEQIVSERAPLDYVHWQDFRWGWARTWAEVPWVGFRNFLSRDEAKSRFGDAAKNLTYKQQTPTGSDEGDNGSVSDKDLASEEEKCEIWEIWDKKTYNVYWYSKGQDKVLDTKPDPLELPGFWPMPQPLMANVTTTLLVPKADYILAQDIYAQINLLASRISIITSAIKVVGVYDAAASDSVGRMLKEGTENNLIPVDNWAMFAEKGGLKGTVDWFPVEDIVGVLSVLRGELNAWIELLYQQTGMSDILRGGNTDQYTSDGTNQLKAKFGSIRIQALQDQFALFASECEQLRAQVISKHFSVPQIMLQSNAEYVPEADKDKVMSAMQMMQSPSAKWRVAIRPESISMTDFAQLKSERSEFLTATATFLQSATSMVKEVPSSGPMLLSMMQWGLAGFKGSESIEGTLDAAIEQANKANEEAANNPNQEAGPEQLEQMRQQGELAKIQAKLQSDMQIVQAKSAAEAQKIQIDTMSNIREIQAKSQADNQKILQDLQSDMRVIAAKLNADLQVEEAQSTMAIAEKNAQLEADLTKEAVEHQNTLIEQNNQSMNSNRGDD